MNNDGFEVPLHRSLTEPILIGGAPRTVALMNGIVVAAIAVGLHNLWVIVFGVAFQMLCAALTRKDPHFFEVLHAHLMEKDRLDI
jgi:type IV secretion system protein VirB3